MSTRTRTLVACALLCLLAWPVLDASGATSKRKPAKIPSISSMAPMNLGVGDMLTIKGRNFVKGKRRNTVVFKRHGGRAIFVKADTATSTRIKVKIPAKLARFFPKSKKTGKPIRSRFRVRVLARRFGKRFTAVKKSPLIGPANVATPTEPAAVAPTSGAPAPAPSATAPGSGTAVVDPRGPDGDCDGDGQLNGVDGDDDNDMLSDALEVDLGLDACRADTDGDGMEDAWEYESAIDLNIRALPYPGSRPYPNPLDGGDGGQDYDGDNLTGDQEHALWVFAGPRSRVLSYNGGQKYSGGQESVPASADPALAHLDFDGDGWLSDNERDADGDRLANWDEFNGRMTPSYWPSYDAAKYEGLDPLNADTDGDGIRDDADDIDHDDFDNFYELSEVVNPGVNPFHPCFPNANSRTCPEGTPK